MSNIYLAHSAKGTTWSKKDHKYLDIINGRYIYTKSQLEKAQQTIDKSDDSLNELIKMYQGELDRRIYSAKHPETKVPHGTKLAKNLGIVGYLIDHFTYNADRKRLNEESKLPIRKADARELQEAINKAKELKKLNQQRRIANISKYQNSWNYSTRRKMKEFSAKGKAFINKLFGKKTKKRSTSEALARNNRLRGASRTIKRKGFGKYGTLG